MAVVAMCGFEMGYRSGAWHEPVSAQGAGTFQAYPTTAQARTGAYALRCNTNSGQSAYLQGFPNNASVWVHFGLYIATMPSVSRVICGQAGGTLNLQLNSNGTLRLYTAGGSYDGTTQLQTGQWYWLGVRFQGDASSHVFVQIDGNDEITCQTSYGGQPQYLGCYGTEASGIDIYIDDYIQDDAGFLAPSNVALLVPISDNTVGAGWRLGNAAAMGGNGWEAINNIPPAGVASASETATTNIEHPGGGAGSEWYSANLTTYAAAGVAAGDTLLGIQAFIRHGEDVSTGTKYIGVGLSGNPDDLGYDSLTVGADAGAHVAEVGQWKTSARSVYSNLGGVTLGNSPVIQVGRTGTESRVACVDFMGAYVGWTPAAAAERVPRREQQYPQLLAG